MAASLTAAVVDGAPGNVIQVAGSGLVPGVWASVSLSNQGVTATPGLTPVTISLSATFATSSVSIGPLPDGVMDGTLTVTAGDSTSATCALRTCTQYVQASEYLGEGEDTSSLATGELDAILRRASALCDAFMGGHVRYLQVLERHVYRASSRGAPRVFPFRPSGRKLPIKSIDQLSFVSAEDLVTVFNVSDMYVNQDANYVEILAYAIGNYALLGQLQIIGYSANVLELAYTAGYKMAEYPNEIRTATLITATMMLNRRRRQSMGMGPFKKFESEVEVDPIAVQVPREARLLLIPWVSGRFA